ncbi:hypothetical protein V5799_031092 [Amblyomma americanum]|uniref:M13 family peptidase n=1 Tax=Amblyomma americanum TaxID=6943 RepID=A0AAQ4EMB1_AMBAM
MTFSPMSPHDEIYRRLADRRPATTPRSLYRGRDNDYLILVGFLATLGAVFIVFLHYDFAATRLVRPSTFAASIPKQHQEADGYVITWAARRGVEATPAVHDQRIRAKASPEGAGSAEASPKDRWHPKKKNSSRDWASARPRWLARIGAPEPLFRDFSRMGDVHDEWYLTAAQGIAGHRDMRGLFRVEQALVELAAHRRGAGDYARTTVARLAHAPHWNWTRFLGIVFRGIATFGRRTPVLVKGGSFQRQLAALISQFGPVHMLNYLAFRLHIQYAPFLERRPRFLTLAQLSAAWQPGWHDGDPPDDVSDLRCLRLMTSAVPELMAFVYWNGARPRGRKRDRSKQEAQRSRGFRDMTRHLVDWTVRTAPHELERAHGRGHSRISSLLRAIELLRHQLFLPEWLHKSRLRMRFAELAFADAEESPLVSWRGLLASRKRNALLKIADRGFETFWEGSALRDTPWLDADEEYLAVPPGAVDTRFHMGAVSSGANVTYGTDQLFFYEFAMDRCEAYDEAYLQQRTVNGLRSPAPTLVNGPLRNLRTFARAFNCSRGSPMSPERICKL